jgi:hypothetical protein
MANTSKWKLLKALHVYFCTRSEVNDMRLHLQNGVVPKKDDVKPQQQEELDSSESESSEEDAEAEEVEAEEEILPIMVAPGHLRFERDEGNCALNDPSLLFANPSSA